MPRIRLNLFPGGVTKALTLSYDDGREFDRRLVEILNTYGIKASFHLNSALLGKDGYVTAEETAALYKGHEISAHTCTHPFLDELNREAFIQEILDDRKHLEQIAGYPVRGMSYPFGAFNSQISSRLPELGIEYSRTVHSTGNFYMPSNWLEWHPTCHHHDMLRLGKDFVELNHHFGIMQLFYVWGHSYEFHDENNWSDIERFCELTAGKADTWYATNMEIVDYMQALRALRFSVDQAMVLNKSAIDVWITVDGSARHIAAGQMVTF